MGVQTYEFSVWIERRREEIVNWIVFFSDSLLKKVGGGKKFEKNLKMLAHLEICACHP